MIEFGHFIQLKLESEMQLMALSLCEVQLLNGPIKSLKTWPKKKIVAMCHPTITLLCLLPDHFTSLGDNHAH